MGCRWCGQIRYPDAPVRSAAVVGAVEHVQIDGADAASEGAGDCAASTGAELDVGEGALAAQRLRRRPTMTSCPGAEHDAQYPKQDHENKSRHGQSPFPGETPVSANDREREDRASSRSWVGEGVDESVTASIGHFIDCYSIEETESSCSSSSSSEAAKPVAPRNPTGLRAGSRLMSRAIFSSSQRYGTRRLE